MTLLGCIALILSVIASFDHNKVGCVEALDIGVCYGTLGSDLPAPADTINLYKKYGIAKMRLFDPNPAVLGALRGSGIGVTIGVPTADLEGLATGGKAAVETWYNNNVASYVDNVTINYIAVGNEADISGDLNNVLIVMTLLHDLVSDKGIKVTTAISTLILASSYPPSNGTFKQEASSAMSSILAFLASIDSPLLINVYPYFAYQADPSHIRLDYAQFTATETVVKDGNYSYTNLFDAMVDAYIAAIEKAGGASNINLVVSETGWPSDGNGNMTTPQLAATYNKNFMNHIIQKKGTQRRPGANIEGFIFAMFNENQKQPAGTENHYGLFYPNMQPVYDIFSEAQKRKIVS